MSDFEKKTTKPWQLKSWREQRERIIGKKCVRCGSEQQPLVVQHSWHPLPFKEVHQEVMNRILNEKIFSGVEKSSEQIVEPFKDVYLVNCCPSCSRQNISERKHLLPKYRCALCAHEFDIPGTKFNRKHPAVKKILSDHWKGLYQKYKKEILDTTDSICEQHHQRYVSMVDASTYCKRCAYLEDVHGKVICRVCNQNYHDKRFVACKPCILKAFNNEADKRNIGKKNDKCKECFWFLANPETWSDFQGTALRMIEVKERKCHECTEGKDNFSALFKCKNCGATIDGHNYFLHGSLCDHCFD